MRRAFLTAAGPQSFMFGPSISQVGGSDFFTSAFLTVQEESIAPKGGRISLINFYSRTSAILYVYTGTLVGSIYTIRDSDSFATTNAGLQSAAVSIAVQAGDVLGFWSLASIQKMLQQGTGGTILRAYTGSAPPTAGSKYTMTSGTTTNASVLVNAVGS